MWSLSNAIAQYRLGKKGVLHTTLNPEGPGAVRMHLVPPRWNPFFSRHYVLILNGHYVLPLGYSWAVLLARFIEAAARFEGRPMNQTDTQKVMNLAVEQTRLIYSGVPAERIADDLQIMLGGIFDIARGKPPEMPEDQAAGKAQAAQWFTLRDYAPFMQAPNRMDLLVSAMRDKNDAWQCNLRCVHCYASQGQNAGNAELSTAEWKAIIDRCRTAGIPQLTFTGGEPTLRGDLPELINHARWFVTRLNTNGILLDSGLCRQLAKASLDSVQITVYSSIAAIHERLTGVPDSFAQTIAGLENALAAGLNVSVNTPLCRENSGYENTLEFLRQKGVCYASCSGIIQAGGGKSGVSRSMRLSEDEIFLELQKAAEFCVRHEMELSFTSPGQVSAEKLRSLGLSVPMCGACLSNMAIAPNGMVIPCQSWLNGGWDLGNMLSVQWKKIWNHQRCREIRKMDEALCCPLGALDA